MGTKSLDFIDWTDREGFLHALEEQADRYRRFRDNNQHEEPKAAQQCNGCALTVRVFGVDIEINDKQRQIAVAESELDNCRGMEWRGRPLTNLEMNLQYTVLQGRRELEQWWNGFVSFIEGLGNGERVNDTTEAGNT